jgi:hypothetical protein
LIKEKGRISKLDEKGNGKQVVVREDSDEEMRSESAKRGRRLEAPVLSLEDLGRR